MIHSETHRRRLTWAGIVAAVVLFACKLAAGLVSGSIAVMSDALNSLFDIASYTAMYVSVRVQDRQPDYDHHFGHRRAEPVAGLLIAIFAAILGATLLKDAVLSLFVEPPPITATPLAAFALLLSIAVKGSLAVFYKRAARDNESPALQAGYVDSRNDVAASGVALAGYWLSGSLDSLAGAVIGIWILLSGVRIGLHNLGFLMGKAPNVDILNRFHTEARAVPHVLGSHDVRAHYVGDRLHVEIHIEVPETLSLREAHDVAVAVQRRLESLEDVQSAFVHIDPVPCP